MENSFNKMVLLLVVVEISSFKVHEQILVIIKILRMNCNLLQFSFFMY